MSHHVRSHQHFYSLSQLLLKLIIISKLGTRWLRHLGDSQAVGVEGVQDTAELGWQCNGRAELSNFLKLGSISQSGPR